MEGIRFDSRLDLNIQFFVTSLSFSNTFIGNILKLATAPYQIFR
jgi:hypothetical protein